MVKMSLNITLTELEYLTRTYKYPYFVHVKGYA